MDKAEILQTLRAHANDLRQRGVVRLALFGSYARGTATPESDVDLLVEFAPGRKSYDAFLDLALFLEDLLDRRVELITMEALSPHLAPSIMASAEDAIAA